MSGRVRWLALVTLLLGGCASLNVNVDLYSGPLPGANRADATRLANSVLVSAEFDANARSDLDKTTRDALGRQFVEDQTRKLVANLNPATDAGRASARTTAETNWGIFDTAIASEQAELGKHAAQVRAAASSLRSQLATTDPFEPQVIALDQAYGAYASAREEAWGRMTEVFCTFENCVLRDETAKGGEFGRDKVRDRMARLFLAPNATDLPRRLAASARTNGRVVGYPIFDPDFENLKVEKEYWKPFYTGHFSSRGGSSRFVVVRQGLVMFDQKGLDFDPTPVIGAATALAKVGLQLAAAKALGRASFTAPGGTAEQPSQPTDTQFVNEAKVRAQELALTERAEARVQALTSLATLARRIEAAASLGEAALEKEKNDLLSVLHHYEGRLAATEIPQ